MPPRPQLGSAARVVVLATRPTQAAKSCPASRARPLGGGCGASPRWLRIFSITGRQGTEALAFAWRKRSSGPYASGLTPQDLAAMILSAPLPRLGQCCMSMSRARLSSRAHPMRCGAAGPGQFRLRSHRRWLPRWPPAHEPTKPAAPPAPSAWHSAPARHAREAGVRSLRGAKLCGHQTGSGAAAAEEPAPPAAA